MLNVDTRLLENLDDKEYYTLCHLANFLNKNTSCYPKKYTLMKATGYGRKKLDAAIKGLIEKGMIEKKQRHDKKTGDFKSNLYTFTTSFIGIYVNAKGKSIDENGDEVIDKSDEVSVVPFGVDAKRVDPSRVDAKGDNKVLDIDKVLNKDKVLGRAKEEPTNLSSFDNEKIEQAEKWILKKMGRKVILDLMGGIEMSIPELVNKIATSFVMEGKTLDETKPWEIKGLITYATKFIENEAQNFPMETEESEDARADAPMGMSERIGIVFDLYDEKLIRRTSPGVREGLSWKVKQLIKEGVTFEEFGLVFDHMTETGSHIWKDVEYALKNYDRAKNYYQQSKS